MGLYIDMERSLKALLVLVAIFIISISNSWAQGDIEITGFGGYTFKNSFNIVGGSATVGDGATFGGSIAFEIKDDIDLELYYSRQQSTLSAFSVFGQGINFREDGSVSYWMIGGSRNFQSLNPNLYFFTSVRFGGVTFSTNDRVRESTSKFAASFGGGLKYFVSDQIGIKITGNLLYPIFDAGAGLYFGTGGSGIGVSTWSPMLQFNFNGGVFFRIIK